MRVGLTNVGRSGDNLGSDNHQQVVEDGEHSDAANDEPAPLHDSVGGGTKDTGEDHDDIGEDDTGSVVGVHVTEDDQIHQQKRGGEKPVDITGIVEASVDVTAWRSAVDLEGVVSTTAGLNNVERIRSRQLLNKVVVV